MYNLHIIICAEAKHMFISKKHTKNQDQELLLGVSGQGWELRLTFHCTLSPKF